MAENRQSATKLYTRHTPRASLFEAQNEIAFLGVREAVKGKPAGGALLLRPHTSFGGHSLQRNGVSKSSTLAQRMVFLDAYTRER